MSLNNSIHYQNGSLYIDEIAATDIASSVGTPVYVYSLKRALENYQGIKSAFSSLDSHIHYSAKANANLTILKTLIEAGAGIDCVSAGEIFRALKAGAKGENIVFAGVGKTRDEIQFGLENRVGWFNVENIAELDIIKQLAANLGLENIQVALRLNPNVTANTHPNIATGHGGAKFGLTVDAIAHVLAHQQNYPQIKIAGLHVHIGSQLGDTRGTVEAVEKALELITPYEHIRTLNIGGGLPAAYHVNAKLPGFDEFAQAIKPLVNDYTILLEPGRSIIADAGVLLASVLYEKKQAAQRFIILDASMTDIIRPMLYQAHHDIVPLMQSGENIITQVVGPVCETTDVLGRNAPLPELSAGDGIAVLTAGAYGMVMASNYNARPRPAEVVVNPDGNTWRIARQRETWEDLLRGELVL
jgi:diaminopimelate decarboxylase